MIKTVLTDAELKELVDLLLRLVPDNYKVIVKPILLRNMEAENKAGLLVSKIRTLKSDIYYYSLKWDI